MNCTPGGAAGYKEFAADLAAQLKGAGRIGYWDRPASRTTGEVERETIEVPRAGFIETVEAVGFDSGFANCTPGGVAGDKEFAVDFAAQSKGAGRIGYRNRPACRTAGEVERETKGAPRAGFLETVEAVRLNQAAGSAGLPDRR